MALPILATLGKSVRAVYPFVRKGIQIGLSGNQIQNALIAAGMGVARAPLLRLIKAERNAEVLFSQLKFIGFDKKPDPLRLPLARTKIIRDFSYIVKITALEEFTNTIVDRFITISTSENMTRRQLEDKAQKIFENDVKEYPLLFIGKLLWEGMKKGRLGTFK